MNYGKKSAREKQQELSSKSRKKKGVGVTLVKSVLVCVFLVSVVGIVLGGALLKSIIDSAPSVSSIEPSAYSTIILDNEGNEVERLVASGSNRIYKEINEIPQHLQDAFIAIEDERFYEHNGIDLRGIIRAGFRGITSGSFSEGASTITQQLLKNNVLTGWTEETSLRESGIRKIQEQYLAMQVEKEYDKQTILQNYLNTINLGQNTLGVQAASKRYFNKDVSDLTLSESAVIAGITKSPTNYNPVTYPEKNAERRELILDNMLEQGYITQSEHDEAMADDVYSRIQDVNDSVEQTYYTYFVDALIEQVKEDLVENAGYTAEQAEYALYSGGLTIQSTLDPEIQEIVDTEFTDESNYPDGTYVELSFVATVHRADGTADNYSSNQMKEHYKTATGNDDYNLVFSNQEAAEAAYEVYKEEVMQIGDDDTLDEKVTYPLQPQASIVIMDQYTGYVKALYGGRGEKVGNMVLNRATGSTRQPGSTFKVLTAFAPAIDSAGYTLGTVQDDAEYYYTTGEKKQVSNWYSGYKGYSTIRQGVEQSMNIVAAKTIADISPDLGFDYAVNFGISTLSEDSDKTESLALGGLTNGVTNLELTAAYAAIANYGVYNEPKLYTEVLDHDGNAVLDNTSPEGTRVIKDTTASLLTSAMEDVVTKGTGTAVALSNMPVAGKTGTTTDDKDFWFSGYTPYYTASIWSGFDTPTEAPNSVYKNFHKTMWQKIMSQIHQGLSRKEFDMSSSLTTATICKKSGKLAITGVCDHDPRGNMTYTEYFAPGTKPTETCDHHVSVSTCSVTGMQAGEYCPHDDLSKKVYMKRDEDAVGTTDDSSYQVPGICTLHNADYSGDDGLSLDDDDDSDDDLIPGTEDPDDDSDDVTTPGNEPTEQDPSDPADSEQSVPPATNETSDPIAILFRKYPLLQGIKA